MDKYAGEASQLLEIEHCVSVVENCHKMSIVQRSSVTQTQIKDRELRAGKHAIHAHDSLVVLFDVAIVSQHLDEPPDLTEGYQEATVPPTLEHLQA